MSKIRPMKKEHIQEVLDIEALSFTIRWSKNAFIQEVIHNKLARYLVLMDNNRVIGYGGMWFVLDEAHITNIAVHPDYRGMGKGRVLMEALIELAKENSIEQITLEVRQSNEVAIKLYKSLGFIAMGLRKEFYYDNGEDALIMWKGKDISQL